MIFSLGEICNERLRFSCNAKNASELRWNRRKHPFAISFRRREEFLDRLVGDKAAIAQDKANLRQDRQELRNDRAPIRQDHKDLRADHKDLRMDRR